VILRGFFCRGSSRFSNPFLGNWRGFPWDGNPVHVVCEGYCIGCVCKKEVGTVVVWPLVHREFTFVVS